MSLRLRRAGGASGGPIPPETPEFGPIEGRQAIIDNSGPRVVPAPPPPYNEITTADNANFNTILTANPGERFWVRAGTYNRATLGSILPKADQTIHCEPGTVFEFGQTDNQGIWIQAPQPNVTWRGGVVQNVGSVTSTSIWGLRLGGPNVGGATQPVTGVTVEDLEVGFTLGNNGAPPYGGQGIDLACNNSTIRHCHSHHNGRSAYKGGGDNVTITRCEFNNNNTQGANPAGEAGTGKANDNFGGSFNNLQIEKNYVHDDAGFGIWTDGVQPMTTGVTISENVIENLTHAGIMIELTPCAVSISRNYLFGNGAGSAVLPQSLTNRWQILISTSNGLLGAPGGIVIANNIVDAINTDHSKLIGLVQHDSHGTLDRTRVKGVTVRNNQCFMRTVAEGGVGGHDTSLGRPLFSEPTIDWHTNQYNVRNLNTLDWRWADPQGNGANKDFAAWQAYGFDPVDLRVVI